MTTKQLSKAESATGLKQVPSFITSEIPARGSEQAGMDDIIVPRLVLLQQLSPHLDEAEEAYIEGAKAGDIVNSVTGVNYGKSLTIIPVYFKKEVLVWKDRQKGGGFFGSYATKHEANMVIDTLEPPASDYTAEDTASQFVLIVNDDGTLDQAVLSMSKTKLSCSRKLQSLIRMTEIDSFAHKYTLSSVAAQSDLGKYFNFSVKPAGFVSEEEYHAGEACYNAVAENISKYKTHDGEAAAAPEKF